MKGQQPALLLPPWLPEEPWNALLKQRGSRRNSEYAKHLIILKLDGLRKKGYDPKELLDTAIEHGWLTVFEPRNGNGNGHKKEGRVERILRGSNQAANW